MRALILGAVVALAAALAPGTAHAAPPANDDNPADNERVVETTVS